MHTKRDLSGHKSHRYGRGSITSIWDLTSKISEHGLPLTPIQKETVLLINSGSESAYATFNVPIPDHISPTIDLLQHAWRAVASHNAVLRTRLDISSPDWRQCTLKSIPHIQFGTITDTLASPHGEPARLTVTLSNNRLLASITIHRALIDDLSLPLIHADFEAFFNGVALEPHPDLEGFLRRTASRDENAAKLYWISQLAGKVSAPIHGFPAEPSPLSSQVTATLSREETFSVRKFAAGCKESVQNVFYGAWAANLAVHTEAANNLVTFAVVGRDTSHRDNSDLVGPVDQLYPLAIDMRPDQALKSLIRNIAQTDSQASKFAFIGYDAILDQAEELSGLTLVNVRSCGQNGAVEQMCCNFNRFGLIVDVAISDYVKVTIHYSDSIDGTDVDVILQHFLTAIRSTIKESASSVKDLTLISDAERSYLFDLAKPLTDPVDGLVHKLVESQAEKTPDLPALQFENDAPLSYSQLNSLANGVARQLRCQPGSYIPVCVQRSTNLIVSLYAILKAGCAYVTTDPAVPAQRNNFIFGDVSAPFAIVDRTTQGTFPNEVLIEDLIQSAAKYDQTNLNTQVTPTDIVYIIYTSGSTGNPKGVLLEHRAAYSGLAAFPLIKDLRQLLFHNPVFSAAQRSIWSTLKQGGVLCLASKENLTVNIGRTINTMQINTIDVTPSTATFIKPGTVPSLTRMTVAGELINPALVPLWVHELELMNAYGLSENTQFNWRHVIEPGQNPQDIGRPVDTTTAYVLRPGTTELSPLLVPGELCLGGYQLARGYLNRPEKTKEAFIDNPFGPGRLYRTGDLVTTHANGSIEMIGRIDFSVKINDQRVDPGESNSTIQLHEHVKDSAVVAASISGRMALVAVVVHDGLTTIDQTLKEIRERLEKQLPLYMIPTYWVFREDLPLNINGKVDIPALRKFCEQLGRTGLRTITQSTAEKEEPSTASPTVVEVDVPAITCSPQEKLVINLFSEVLSISPEEISPSASFLDLGGGSLEAMRVASAALDAGLEINVSQLLLGETVSDIAKAMKSEIVPPEEDVLNPFDLTPHGFHVDSKSTEDVLPATPLQEGIIADSMRGKTDYMLPKFFRLTGISLFELQAALQQVVDARPLLRTMFASHGNSFVQVIRKQMDLPVRRTQEDPATYLKRKTTAVQATGLDEPLFKLVGLGDNIAAIETHHALVDSWSYHYIFDDVRSVLKGDSLISRPSFAPYLKHLSKKDSEASRQYWRSYLAGTQATTLPVSDGKGISASIELDHDLGLSDRTDASNASAMLYTAWAMTLSAWLSINDVVFIVNVSGREVPVSDILQIQGPTLSTVPMRVQLSESSTVHDVSQGIIADFWRLAEHAHIGLRNIVKATGLHPLANTAANYLVSMSEAASSQQIEELDIGHQNSNDLATIEMNSKNLRRVKIFSNQGIDHVEDILADIKFVLQAVSMYPVMTVGEIRKSIGPMGSIRGTIPVVQHMSEPDVADGSITPDPVSPRMDPVFDEQDHDEITSSSDLTPASISGMNEEYHKSDFAMWENYMNQAESTLLESSPLRNRQTVKASLPFVKLRAAALKLGVSTRDVVTAAFGIILGKHSNTSPLFGVMVSSSGGMVSFGQEAAHFIPQRMDLTSEASLKDLVRAVGVQQASELAALPVLRADQAFEFATHYSVAFDSFVCFRVKASQDEYGFAQTADLPFVHPKHSSYAFLEAVVDGGRVNFYLSSRTSKIRAQCILEQLSEIIQAAVVSPSAPVNDLALVGAKELRALHDLASYQDPEPQLIHSYFENAARETPGAIAIQFESSEFVTYKNLNERANRFARYLMSVGVGPGSMVPLYMEKSTDMIVSIMAVLKLGAAYVPLSPDNPAKRNVFIMDEIKAFVIISHSQYAHFDNEHKLSTIFVDALPSLGHLESSNIRAGSIDSVAYCIYTSGSTGAPKGVSVSHRAISVSLQGHLKAEKTSRSAKHLLFANYTFDVSVHDILFILGSGATLCVASTKRLMTDLADLINEMGVTQTFLTPTVARLLQPEQVPTLQTLICSGEALTTDIIDTWSGDRTLINLYGPTECAVNVTYGYIKPTTRFGVLGKPLSTASIMMVDRNSLNMTPLGAIGEICVGGSHLADGYLNRPDLTAKAFVACPVPGIDRMYRTGDLGRWLPIGDIEYLGRIDHQVKLNGHRIELGEIEQAVMKSGLTQECVALVLDMLTRPQLAIFGVFDTPSEPGLQSPATAQLVRELEVAFSSLAHYMVPHYIFPVAHVPRSSANKTDRKALKEMAESLDSQTLSSYTVAAAQSEQGGAFEIVSSPEQVVLQSIWANMFNIEKATIGATSNFAVLGGDSISAINLASECRKAGYKLDINDVLTLGTLKDISSTMIDTNAQTTEQVVPVAEYKPPQALQDLLEDHGLGNEDVEYVYPCPPGQTEFLLQGNKKNQSWVVTAVRPFDTKHSAEEYLSLLQNLTRVHDILRTTFTSVPGHGWIGVVLKDPIVNFSIRNCQPSEKDAVVASIQRRRFTFGEPFVRYVLLNYPSGEREIVIKADHGLWDGTSLRIVDDTVRSLQNTGAAPAQTPFADFIWSEHHTPKQPALDFWQPLARAMPAVTARNPSQPSPQTNRIHSHPVPGDIDANTLARLTGVTPSSLFQGIFQLWQASTTSSPTATYDYLLTGRNVSLPDPQSIPGTCANFLPFHLPVPLTSSLPSYLSATQSFFWRATTHASVGLTDIFAAAGRDRDEVANKSLFLFQPFEPAPAQQREDMRWLVLGLSKATMPQPYELVEEVHKTDTGYRFVIKYDGESYSEEEVRGVAERQVAMLRRMAGLIGKVGSDGVKVGDLL